MAKAIKETMWKKTQLNNLYIKIITPILFFRDNLSTTKLVKNPILHARTKYIKIQYLFIKDKASLKEIEVIYILNEEQQAYILTKPLKRIALLWMIRKIRLKII